jgi:FkbM family methyltransferase
VIREIVSGDMLFGAVPEYRVGPSDVILDVGAHVGAFAIEAARRVPDGRVLAVEASLESFNYLRVNRALNGADNLEVDHLALSDRQGMVMLYHDIGNWGHSITKRLSSRTERVPSETLAGYLNRKQVDRCDFAKLNCEGAEFPILLSSSAETLGRFRRLLVLYHTDLVPNQPVEALEGHLVATGFRLRHFNRARGRGWIYAER